MATALTAPPADGLSLPASTLQSLLMGDPSAHPWVAASARLMTQLGPNGGSDCGTGVLSLAAVRASLLQQSSFLQATLNSPRQQAAAAVDHRDANGGEDVVLGTHAIQIATPTSATIVDATALSSAVASLSPRSMGQQAPHDVDAAHSQDSAHNAANMLPDGPGGYHSASAQLEAPPSPPPLSPLHEEAVGGSVRGVDGIHDMSLHVLRGY